MSRKKEHLSARKYRDEISKRKQQHVSAVYFPAGDEYIDSTIRRTRDAVPRPFPHAHPFQASKASFMEIPGLVEVSDDIGERIYLTELYISILEIRNNPVTSSM
ncbi:hypothetical protein E2986_10826 [Frieseomelitta varia]|uniref:Uncharacterized protein n=1 Tax=Frieseomelitta varia TaxID=561572 RepID=A0A833S835_9HYME|nr:hypothetical protein E2986_10826 [Frieseomelitta varia]